MLGARLDELGQRENPPFIRAAADRGLFPIARTKDEAVLQALVANDGVTRGLDALVTELAACRAVRLHRDRARARQAGDDARLRARRHGKSGPRVGEPRRRVHAQLPPGRSAADDLAGARVPPPIRARRSRSRRSTRLPGEWFPDANRLVIVSAPDAAGVVLPTEAQLAAVVKAAAAKRLEAYVDTAAGQSADGRATGARHDRKDDASARRRASPSGRCRTARRVVLKPTKLKEDQILFRATAPGGTSLASDAEFIPARVADSVVPAGGVGQFSAVMLDKILAGKAVAVTPFIDEIDQGMGGGSTPQDLETMFQLMYLRFTQPRADPTAFAAMASQARGLLANQMASPDVVFNQAITQRSPGTTHGGAGDPRHR